ncbi:hypothetical protein PPYR_00641 [Photinus pyralis]|uniref:Uncharacterized protein n=1 Tax=Photinus pyralis TaxID=7054 RepID=A0A5N4B230_PHOPY|nr:uncharacterized protein LOC116172080 [Photinus pyralis]KAB0803671.1 hypothetical protein PPYR_00641 [Photinus pyralis]
MEWYWYTIVFVMFMLIFCLRFICKHGCNVEPDYRRNEPQNISSPAATAGFQVVRQHISIRDEYSSMCSPLTESSSLSDSSMYRSNAIPTLSTPYPPSISTLSSVYPPPLSNVENINLPYRSEQIASTPSDDLPPSYEVATGQLSSTVGVRQNHNSHA